MAFVELSNDSLENIVGGTAYDPVTKSIGIDRDHMIYHYNDFNAVFNWINNNVHSFAPETRERDVINGLLNAGLIF